MASAPPSGRPQVIIDDAMVERACSAFYGNSRGNTSVFKPEMRKALEAALSDPQMRTCPAHGYYDYAFADCPKCVGEP